MHTRLQQLVRPRAAHLGTQVALPVRRTLSGHREEQRAPHVARQVTSQVPTSRLRSVCRSRGETVVFSVCAMVSVTVSTRRGNR